MTVATRSAPEAAASAVSGRRPIRKTRYRRSLPIWVTALLFLLPTLILLVALRFIPGAEAVSQSFQKGSAIAGGGEWVGLENYLILFSDPQFIEVLGVTGLFLIIIVPGQIIAAVFLAVLLNEQFPGLGTVRAFIFLPVAAPAAVASVVWGVLYQPQGPFNAVLSAVGLPTQPFLTSPDQALISIILLMSWIGVGYWTLFLVAGLQDIPQELYEAATLDGAGWWRTFWSVTLPNLRRPLAFVIVADTVASVITFVPVALLTKGGPAGSTRLVMYDLYNNTFVLGSPNMGQTQVVVLLVFLIVITSIQFKLLSREK